MKDETFNFVTRWRNSNLARCLLLVLLMTCSVVICSAQAVPVPQQTHPSVTGEAPGATVLATNADGSLQVEFRGVKYRALTIDQLQKVSDQNVALRRASEERDLLKERLNVQEQLIATLNERLELIGRERDLARQSADDFRKLADDERALREQAVRLVKGNPSAFTRFLNHPATRFFITVAPVALSRVKF